MKKPFALLLYPAFLFIAMVLMVNAAIAQDIVPDDLDADKDGMISIKEAVAAPELLAEFGRIDLNHDGYIDAMEMGHALRQAQRQAQLVQKRAQS